MQTKRNGRTSRSVSAATALLLALAFALSATEAAGQEKPAQKSNGGKAENKTQQVRRSGQPPARRTSGKKKTARTGPGGRNRATPEPPSKQKKAPESRGGEGASKQGEPAKDEGPPTPEDYGIDPEVQKKIDEMFRMRGQTPPSEVLRRGGAKPPVSRTPASGTPTTPGQPTPPDGAAVDAITPLDISPAEDRTPPEERTYGFAIKNGTYAQLVEGFARQTGLGVIGDAPAGQITFVTTEELSFHEALGRIRMILFNYKAHEPYWLHRTPTHLQVTRVTDFYRILPLERMYSSVEAYRAAGLRDDDLALVVYTPEAGSVANLNQLRDWLPDYVRISPLGDQNRLTVFGLVSDIEKYLQLIRKFPGEGDDTRIFTRISVQYVSASDALNKLGSLIDIDPQAGARQAVRRPGRGGTPDDLQGVVEPPVSIIPDDSQGVLIVRAMQHKIEEIRSVLEYIDVDVSAENPPPATIPLRHAKAEDIVPVVQQLISASSSPGEVARTPTRRRRVRKSTSDTGAAAVSADSVSLLAHPSKNAIIVFAVDEAAFEDVKGFVEMLDVSGDVGWTRIQLKHAGAEAVKGAIDEMFPLTTGKGARQVSAEHQLILDPSGRGLWYTGPEQTLERIKEIIAIIDVPQEPIGLHSVRLTYRKPSFVIELIRQWEGSSEGLAISAPDPKVQTPRRRPRRAKPAPTVSGSFTADDDNMTLLALCTDSEWNDYVAFIASVDKPAEMATPFERLAVENLAPQDAVEQLSSLIGTNQLDSAIRLAPSSDSLLVIGATPQDVERIKLFLAEIDKPALIENRTYTIRFAEPAEIKAILEALIGDSPAPRSSGVRKGRITPTRKVNTGTQATGVVVTAGAGASFEMTIVEFGNKLIVQATPTQHEEVKAIIDEFDVREGQPELRVYADFPPGSDIEGIAETIRSVLTGTKQPLRGGRRAKDAATGAALPEGPQFIPQPSSGRLIVIAEPTLYPEIERLLDVLRVEAGAAPPVVAIMSVQHVDAEELVARLEPILEIKVKSLVESGELGGEGEDPVASTARAKLRGRIKTATSDRYHIAGDSDLGEITVVAPQVLVDQIDELVRLFDKPSGKGDVVFRTVTLTNAEPGDMVRALKEMTGKPTVGRLNRARRGATPKAKGSSPTGESLTIVEAPGGGAIILQGLEEDVNQAEEWIRKLDAMSSPERQIKVYEIETADMTKLFELIINVVETPVRVAGARVPRPPRSRSETEEASEAATFTTSKSYSSQDVYIQADLIGRTMLVAATPGKARQIEQIVNRFETDEELAKGVESDVSIPKRLFELEYRDAIDAAWDLEGVLSTLWEPQEKLPQVESALFGNYLLVRYPDESRFDEIEEYIKKFVDVPDPDELRIVRKAMRMPKGLTPSIVAELIGNSITGVEVRVENQTPTEEEMYEVEQVRPPGGGGSCALPAAFYLATSKLLASIAGQQPGSDVQQSETPDRQPKKKKPAAKSGLPSPTRPPRPNPPAQAQDSESMIREAIAPIIEETKVKKRTRRQNGGDDQRPAESKKLPEGQFCRIVANDVEGTLVVECPEGVIPDIELRIDELKEEVEDLPVAPDIRIYRVRYIDVYTATDIINEMFNATREQRQQLLRMQQQQQRVQVARQRAQQQQQQRDQREGDDGQRDPRQSRETQQQRSQQQIPQLPPTTVRVYPNPRDRTLILRAEASQYPQIRKLLATIDQPKPIDSFMRTYPLKHLDAVEVEEMLKDMLGLDVAAQRRGRTPRIRPGRTARAAGGATAGDSTDGAGTQLPETILQTTVSGSNQLEVDPGDVKLFSSESTNSIMVMAPEAALDYIGKIIDELDKKDGLPGRTTRYYTLKHAEVTEVVQYLASHFGSEAPKGGGGRGGQGITRVGDSPNAPTFIGYPRLNQITVIANQVQFDEIEPILATLDVAGTELQTETITLQYANPEDVAESINQIFQDRQKALKSLEGKTTVSPFEYTVVVTPDVQTKQIIVQASETNMELVRLRVAALDTEDATSVATEIRTYPIKFADPNAVVSIINQWAKSRERAGGRQRTVRASDTVLATAEPATQMVVVVASDENHIIVTDLISRLDDEKLATQLRKRQVLRLKHASAGEVANQLTQVFRNAVRRRRSDRGPTFVADPKTNFIIADVNDEELTEITELLAKIDVEPPLEGERMTEVYPLRYADPGALNSVVLNMFRWDVRSQPSPSEQVTSAVEWATQSLIVTASAKNHEVVGKLIEKVDVESSTVKDLYTYKLQKANAEEVAQTLQQAYRGRRSTRRGDQPVQITPEPSTNALLIFANATEMAELETLIHSIDVEPSGQDVHVVTLKHADADALAKTLTELYGRRGRGRSSEGTVISAIPGSRALVVRTNAAEFDRIQATIAELDTEESAVGGEVRLVSLLYADASEILSAMQEYLRKTGGRGRGELSGDVRLAAMGASNAIMVAGAIEEVDRLEGIIKAMDTIGEKGSVPQIIPVKYANVGMIVSSLQEIFKESGRGVRRGRGPYQPPIIVADELGNNLIVRASPTDLQAIEGLVARIDTEDKQDLTPYKIISLPAGMNPDDTAEMIERTINETAEARAAGLRGVQVPRISVASDRRTNSITISGSASLFADAEAFVKQLEEMGPPGGTATRVLKVRNVAVDDIQRLIDQLTQQGSSGGGSRGSIRRGGSDRRSSTPVRRGGSGRTRRR